MKLFILGLDGATFDLLDPLLERGDLPALQGIAAAGVRAPLRTIFPPVTGPAWLAIATGLNPGRTGVFDYINRAAPGADARVPVSSAYYAGRALWDLLGDAGHRVGVYNYPTLSPPPAVRGFSVSGMGGYRKEKLCYPEELEAELQAVTGGYEVQLNLRDPRYLRDEQLFLDDVQRVIGKQHAALRHLMGRGEWDFLFAVFHFTDWMQHLLWRHLDPSHPDHRPGRSEAVRARFEETWRKIDGVVADLLAALPPETVVMVVSDHGAGPIDSAFYPNTWLEQKGYLRKNAAGWKAALATRLRPLTADVDNKYLSRFGRLLRRRLLGDRGVLGLIDQERSLAYSPEHAAMFGCVNLTRRGRELPGFRERLAEELRGLGSEVAGVEEVRVVLPEQEYRGDLTGLAPDILFVVNGYRASVEIDFRSRPFLAEPALGIRTGGHRDHGIFLAAGPGVRTLRPAEVSVLDIAPTALALFGAEIPAEVDGRVLTECFRGEELGGFSVRRAAPAAGGDAAVESGGDLEEMKRTLESLGYM